MREKRIRLSRKSLWEYCVTTDAEFYSDDKEHLKELCEVLQALYESRIVRNVKNEPWRIVETVQDNVEICKRLITNIPPRHGKTRTLVNFCKWVFGKNIEERIITCSYNDTTASDFSRYTRDGITEEKNMPYQIVYSDIFPNTKIKDGNAGFEKWALDGQFFNYLGAGLMSGITSKGGTILLVDDPVKDAETAYNETALDKIWLWYTSTFLSRTSAVGGEAIEIVNMTRWSKKDICGRILEGPEANEWYVLKKEAYNKETDEMLCPALLSRKRYLSLQTNMDEAIFAANYHQEPIDIKGRLYNGLKEYTDIPRNENGESLFEQIISYTDTADEGTDWLCSLVAGVYQGEGWLLDVYYTQKPMEVTEVETARFLVDNNVTKAKIESNNGGRGFARNVERIIWEKHGSRTVSIEWFHQTENKMARILTNSSFVINHIFFPQGWNYKYPEFYKAVTTFQKEGKNKTDDSVDALSGVAEMINKKQSATIRFLGD